MLLGAVAVGEETGRLDHELDLEVAPREAGGIPLREDFELGLAGGDDAVAHRDVLVELAEDGVVLEQVAHRLRVAEVVDRDDLEVPAAFEVRAEEVAADPPETVDAYTGFRHGGESKGGRDGRPVRLSH